MAIRNLIILMLENRSFDHMVGYLRSTTYPIDGLTGHEINYPDPITKHLPPVHVSDSAPYVPDLNPSPGHEFANVALQITGGNPPPSPSVGSNVGFVADYAAVAGGAKAPLIMQCFRANMLPALTALAGEFAICDRWFSSMPGPTWPNRFFAHCSTSGGFIDNALRNYPMRTIFQNLSDAGINWRVYYHDFPPQSMALANQHQYFTSKYELFSQAFVRDCAAGLLPRYSFIEPRYFNFLAARANDQHPNHGVLPGELLIVQVYEALRASPQWPESILIITWDEHGGFYDHVPPAASVPPDEHTTAFDFASYGLRVPAVVVSPLVPKGTISRQTYDHTSILATAKQLFNLPGFLTRRDAAATTLLPLASLAAPRGDAPVTLPRPPSEALSALQQPVGVQAPNDLQLDLLTLARHLDPAVSAADVLAPVPATEEDAAREAQMHGARFARFA